MCTPPQCTEGSGRTAHRAGGPVRTKRGIAYLRGLLAFSVVGWSIGDYQWIPRPQLHWVKYYNDVWKCFYYIFVLLFNALFFCWASYFFTQARRTIMYDCAYFSARNFLCPSIFQRLSVACCNLCLLFPSFIIVVMFC